MVPHKRPDLHRRARTYEGTLLLSMDFRTAYVCRLVGVGRLTLPSQLGLTTLVHPFGFVCAGPDLHLCRLCAFMASIACKLVVNVCACVIVYSPTVSWYDMPLLTHAADLAQILHCSSFATRTRHHVASPRCLRHAADPRRHHGRPVLRSLRGPQYALTYVGGRGATRG